MSTAGIPKAEITAPFGYLLKRFSRKMLGEVPDALGVTWHNRSVLMSSMGFRRKVQKWDKLDPELADLRAHGGRLHGRMLVVPRLRLLPRP